MSMRQLDYLLAKIENYPDKIDKILEICEDAHLLYTVAIEETPSDEMKEMYAGKLDRLNNLMNSPIKYEMDIFEMHEYWNEIKHRSWRDKIVLDGDRLKKTDIMKFILAQYNNIRYDIIKAGFRDLRIGGSGVRPKTEGGGTK